MAVEPGRAGCPADQVLVAAEHDQHDQRHDDGL
jgi:hypothetical protein